MSLNWELHHQEGLYQELPPTSTMNLDTRSPLEIINSDFESFSNFVKFGHVNAVTVPGNKDEIERTLIGSDFDIFAVTETNIHQNTPKSAFEIKNYRFFHQDREGDNHSKGGCGIYCKKELKTKHIPINYDHEKFEVCAVEVVVNKVKVVVI